MIYRFGHFELDIDKAELRADNEPRPLEPQVFALLAFLVEHRERLVSKEEILEKLWERRVVSDSALSSRIKSARKALGDDGKTQGFIKTVHGQGFRFVAAVRVEPGVALALPSLGGAFAHLEQVDLPVDRPSRPSIAVLPFRFVGKSGPYATIAEGLPHDLITELARLRWLFVIARGSSFRLRDDDIDARNVGHRLGVRYCLSGGVEVTGKQLAVTTELADTRDGEVVWAERYTGLVDDVHAFRNEIRSQILAALEIQIPLHEAADAQLQATENLNAWSAYHVGLQHIYRFNRKDNLVAENMFGRAVAQDGNFARAHAGLSFVHFQTAFLHQTDDVASEIALARSCAQTAVDLDSLDPFVNFVMGRTYWLEGDLERALTWLERATSLSPNYAQGIYARAWTEIMAGNGVAARELADFAMQLSPLDPLYYGMLGVRGFSHLAQGEDAEAARWLQRAARSPGAHALIAMIAAAAELMAGNEPAARLLAANVHERDPRLSRADFFRAFPLRSDALRSRFSAALEKLAF
ncbi:MAG: winged helix-turn-helix domain-containing protein [Woeseia sp.]